MFTSVSAPKISAPASETKSPAPIGGTDDGATFEEVLGEAATDSSYGVGDAAHAPSLPISNDELDDPQAATEGEVGKILPDNPSAAQLCRRSDVTAGLDLPQARQPEQMRAKLAKPAGKRRPGGRQQVPAPGVTSTTCSAPTGLPVVAGRPAPDSLTMAAAPPAQAAASATGLNPAKSAVSTISPSREYALRRETGVWETGAAKPAVVEYEAKASSLAHPTVPAARASDPGRAAATLSDLEGQPSGAVRDPLSIRLATNLSDQADGEPIAVPASSLRLHPEPFEAASASASQNAGYDHVQATVDGGNESLFREVDRIVDLLAVAREGRLTVTSNLVVNHKELGTLSLRFEQQRDELAVTVATLDQRAAQHALATVAETAAPANDRSRDQGPGTGPSGSPARSQGDPNASTRDPDAGRHQQRRDLPTNRQETTGHPRAEGNAGDPTGLFA